VCGKFLGKEFEWLEKPFYKIYRVVCPDCDEDGQKKIELRDTVNKHKGGIKNGNTK
jgi:hypothetical protein